MPFNGIPSQDFLDRGNELDLLKRLYEFKRDSLTGNILLEGPPGIGKSELLKQLYRMTFREDKGVVPFYYSFKTATLKGTSFSMDYFSRFVRQYLAFCTQEPYYADNMSTPLGRLMPRFSSLGMDWMIDCLDDFGEYIHRNDRCGQMLAAVAAPINAAQKSGRPVLVMLDDFTMAEQLHEAQRGDSPGLTSLFEESMKNSLCPHIITGSPEGLLEAIFSDHALNTQAERMRLGPLPEDEAYSLFSLYLEKLQIACNKDAALKFIRLLGGNPLYLRNVAKAAGKMQKKELQEDDLRECYSYEVAEGEIAFYWSAVFNRIVQDAGHRHSILKLVMHSISNGTTPDAGKFSRQLGLMKPVTEQALDSLRVNGIIGNRDRVYQDFILCLYRKEIEGKKPEHIRELIENRYSAESNTSCFEMIIPMSSNAELVVAGAIDQIGKNMALDQDMLNSIQLAVIETCINAMEHSGSLERKVLLKFMAYPERLEIIIESTGRHFSLDCLREIPADDNARYEGKRGRGFTLIKKIMDDVKVERVGDRTRVILIKNIRKKEVVI